MLTLPLGGYLADRTGRGRGMRVGGLLAMAATMPVLLAALPGRVLAPQARHLGLGVFFTLYYAGMALLPGVAGWFGERSQVDSAPLVFGAALVLGAAVLAALSPRAMK